jgi:acetyl/propionyl-CoA carboxylase alpha subunit
MTTRELHWRVNGVDWTVRIEESKNGGIFHVSGESIPFRLIDADHIEIAGKRHRFYVVNNHASCTVWLDGHTYYLQRAGRTGIAQAASTATTGEVRALMPGKVLRLEVAAGDTVHDKQTVVVMESMKMETPLQTPKAGRVTEVRCQPGQVVEMGELLMVIE